MYCELQLCIFATIDNNYVFIIIMNMIVCVRTSFPVNAMSLIHTQRSLEINKASVLELKFSYLHDNSINQSYLHDSSINQSSIAWGRLHAKY